VTGPRCEKNRLDQIIWINRFTWLCYSVKKNRLYQIMWVKGFIWPRYGVKKNQSDEIIWIKFIWLRYGVKKNRLDQIIWIKVIWLHYGVKKNISDHMDVSLVWCVSDDVMYEMNYKNFLLFGWDKNPIYEKIYIFLNSLAYHSFLYGICFVFKSVMMVCITRENKRKSNVSREFDRWYKFLVSWWRSLI